jgi:RNA polymerase sigma-70 factor (ECF subfamily)
VRRSEQIDDIRQNAALRLWRALKEVKPASVQGFMNLAAVQIRRELIDLARHYDGPEGLGRHHASRAGTDGSGTPPGPRKTPADTDDPARLASWTEFHTQVDALPAEEKEVFHQVWYQGLTQVEAAALLGITVRVVKYRWRSARLRLHEMLDGRLPG